MNPRVLLFGLLVVGASLVVSPLPLKAQSVADTLLLADRISGADSHRVVTIDALPPGWTPGVPLPSLPVLGSVSSNGANNNVSIYYRPADATQAAGAYVAQLAAAGFTSLFPTVGPATPSGFVGSPPASSPALQMLHAYCKSGQVVYIQRSPAVDDLRVSIFPRANAECPNQPVATVRPFSPLPAIVAPAGDTIQPLGTSTVSAGMSGGGSESITSVATMNGTARLAAVLSDILSQMKSGGWSVSSQLMNSDTAIAKLNFQRAQEQWKANLFIVAGAKPQTYTAHIDAVNLRVQNYHGALARQMGLGASQADFSWVPKKVSKNDEPLLLQIVKQLTTFNGYRPAQLYLRRIPPGFNVRVPLPQATPLAGVVNALQPTAPGQHQYTVYYDLSRAQLQEYSQRLQTQGWKLQSSAPSVPNGFQFAYYPIVQTYCSKSMPSVNLTGSTYSNAVTVNVLQIRPGFSCDTLQAIPPGQTFANPLPRLDAPAGVTMLTASAGVRAGNSGAVITSTQPIGVLLDGFNAKFTQKGWALAATASGPDLASSSYTYVDTQSGGQKWQAVLTLYRSFADKGTYYAFLDLTKLPQAK